MSNITDFEIKDGVLVKYNGNDGKVVIPETVKEIGEEAFMYCDSLKSITIPNSVTKIGDRAFSDCGSLTNVTIPDSVISMGIQVFSDCTKLEDVTIPNSLTTIPPSAFLNCRSLTDVMIPDSVTSIEMYAFFGCSNLETITIPDSVTDIHGWAFDECPNLTICASSNCAEEYAKWKNIRLDNGEYTIEPIIGEPGVKRASKNSRKYIVDEKWSFELPEGLELYTDTEHVNVMDQVRTVDYAVKGLRENGKYYFDFELREVYDDDVVKDYDVLGCRYDTDVKAGNARQRIMQDRDDFYVDVVLKNVLFGYGMYEVRVRGEGIRPRSFTASLNPADEELGSKWEQYGEGNLLLKSLVESIELLKPKKKTSKKKSASKKNKSEKTVSDPNYIVEHGVLHKYIGSDTDITIPEGVKEIADSTFSGFSKLKSVVVPDGVKIIGRRCFENCSELERVMLPESLEKLGEYAFVDCHKLEEVYLSDKLKVIGDSTFSECFALKDVRIPENIREIEQFAFKNCHAFKHIVIPDKVETIGFYAFADCVNMEYVFVPNSVSQFGRTPFTGCNKLVVYTPSGSSAQEIAIESGVSYQNADKGSVTADNSAAKTKGVSSARPSGSAVSWEFPDAWCDDVKKDLIDNQSGYAIRFLPHSIVKKNWEHEMVLFQYNCLHHFPEHLDRVHTVTNHAEKYVSLFEEEGTAEDIRNGKLKNSAPIHVLRSLIWTVIEMQKESKEVFPADAPKEMWPDVAQFISRKGNVNYRPAAKNANRFGIPLLDKEEVHTIYSDACDYEVAKFGEWIYKSDAIGKAMKKASENSLFDLVESLDAMIPVMDQYYDYLQDNNKKEEQTVDTIRLILQGWLVYAFACKQPIFIIPGNLYDEDIEFSAIPDWTQLPEIKENESGKYTTFGSELIKFSDDSPTLVIPEGITGIVLNDDTRSDLEHSFSNTRKIIYPHSFTGPIVVPDQVRTIEVLGNHEVFRMTGLIDSYSHETDLEEIKFIGIPKAIGKDAFKAATKAKQIVIPEGTERLNNFAFSGLDNIKIMLPESLKQIDRDVFSYTMCIGMNAEIHVYKQCPVLGAIKKQLERYKKFVDDHNSEPRSPYSDFSEWKFNIKLIESESPWITRAKSFAEEIGRLYEGKAPNVSESTIKTILVDTIGMEDSFGKCKEPLIKEASARKRKGLSNILKNADDDNVLYLSLPKELADDINHTIEARVQKERKKRNAEINSLSQSDSIEDISRAIAILTQYKSETENADDLIQTCQTKINEIVEEKYSRALKIERDIKLSRSNGEISCEQAIQNYSEAIDIYRTVEKNKDVAADIERCKSAIKDLELRKIYDSATLTPPKTVTEYKSAINTLERIPGFMDADEIRERYQEELKNDYYQKGLQSAKDRTVEGLNNALRSFGEVADYKDAAVMIEKCKTLLNLMDQHIQLEKQLPQLEGFFKRKQRKELELQIADIEAGMAKVEF